MEVALRRRLEGVASIAISQQQQTAEVVFASGPHVFSPHAFRAAVGEADVEVIRFEIEACGRVEPGGPGAPSALGAPGAPGAPGAGAARLPAVAGRDTAAKAGARWFVAGPNRFLLGDGLLPGDHTGCILATLDDGREPLVLVELRPPAAVSDRDRR